jgi:hypothetical protein
MFAIIIIYVAPYATIINIPADYPTIQQGIDASTDGDTVLVQPGMYVENINFYLVTKRRLVTLIKSNGARTPEPH